MRVIVLSGLPGSGKSHHVQENFPGEFVVSADHFFIGEDGVYRFDFTKISLAHQACWRQFYVAVQAKVELIVVDNTNLTAAEISPYMLPAEAMGYQVEIITLETPVELCKVRNTHGVKSEVIDMMAANLASRKLPPWWKNSVIVYSGAHTTLLDASASPAT